MRKQKKHKRKERDIELELKRKRNGSRVSELMHQYTPHLLSEPNGSV